MPYTKTPLNSTDQNTQVPLLQQWTSRDSTNVKDIKNINVIWEIVSGPTGPESAVAIKRDGFSTLLTCPSSVTGVYYFENTGGSNPPLICVFGDFGVRTYRSSDLALVGTWTTTTFPAQDWPIGFTEFQYENGTVILIATNGDSIVRIDTSGVITSMIGIANMPAQHRPFPVYLDGYLFLADRVGNIWNSNLNDPLTWSASNFIAVDAYPDNLLAIARHGVYIVAFGGQSIQFYYDAANPTGTPLAVYSASAPQVGFVGGLKSAGETIYFIGYRTQGLPSLFKLEGFTVKDLGNAAVSRILSVSIPTFTGAASSMGGHILLLNGHRVYTWTALRATGGTPAWVLWYNVPTLAYDLDSEEWLQLKWQNTEYFPILASDNITHSASSTGGVATLMTMGDNNLYKSSPTLYQDVGVTFPMEFVTKNFDYGTRRMKFGARLIVNADQTASPSNMLISWTDDDYQTFSTPRTVNLSNKYTQLYSLGSFRRRAYKITYSDNFPMRVSSLEKDYSVGQA